MDGLDWNQNRFVAELTTESTALLRGGTSPALAAAVTRCAEAAAAVCRDRLAACGPGCPHCCVLNVAALLPEAIVIADWLRQRCDHAEIDRLLQQLADHCCWVRWMEDEERIRRGAACPFLDTAGNCSIYPVRPLSCRGVASLDRTVCERAFATTCSEDDRTVPADLLRRAVHEAAFISLAQSLSDCGLCARSIELGTGVRAFLKLPQYATAFLAGEHLATLWEP